MTPDTREKIRAALEKSYDRIRRGAGFEAQSALKLDEGYVMLITGNISEGKALDDILEVLALLGQEELAPPTPDVEAGRAPLPPWFDGRLWFDIGRIRESLAYNSDGGSRDAVDIIDRLSAALVTAGRMPVLRASAPPEQGQPEGMEPMTRMEPLDDAFTYDAKRASDVPDEVFSQPEGMETLKKRLRLIEAENARLRAALEPFVTFCERMGYHDPFWSDDSYPGGGIYIGDLRRARAALAAEGGET